MVHAMMHVIVYEERELGPFRIALALSLLGNSCGGSALGSRSLLCHVAKPRHE